jgi:acyl carrier protein
VGQSIIDISLEESGQQFGPKIYGLKVLEKVLKREPIDFCILFSSNASIFGGIGLTSYSAANNYVDSFVAHHNKSSSSFWISINWDGWLSQEDEKQQKRELKRSIDKYSITASEGLKVIKKLIEQCNVSQIVVSTHDIIPRAKLWLNQETKHNFDDHVFNALKDESQIIVDKNLHPKNTAGAISQIWEEFLGVKAIDIYDNFFDLGGHSLMAIKILTKIKIIFNIKISLNDFLNNPTISEISKMIDSEMTSVFKDYTVPNPSIIKMNDSDNKPAIFCIHGQGGDISNFNELSNMLGLSFYGAEDPRLLEDEIPHYSIESLASRYTEEILQNITKSPEIIIGWSIGGVIAFENGTPNQLFGRKDKTSNIVRCACPSYTK